MYSVSSNLILRNEPCYQSSLLPINLIAGSLQMSANATFPVCPGENVLFTCISSQSYFTRWIITFASRSVVSQVVENHQLVGSHYSRNQGSINLIFTVRSINPLESTLLMTSSIYYRLLNDAEVECSDLDNVQQIHYIIHEG